MLRIVEEDMEVRLARAPFGSVQAAWAMVLLGAMFQLGCNNTAGKGVNSADAVTTRDTRVSHEVCDVTSEEVQKIDANGDGRPDISIVLAGGREQCRAVDLNFDGVVDAYTYFDPNGTVRRRENDYDRDGQIDEITIFKGAQIAEKDRSTALAQHLDTWDFYQAGALARTERDSNGDGVIDQWWEYPRPGCPLIHADVNNDGRPDPGATIDYCKETGYVPPERADKTAASPTFETKSSLPTETENKPADVPTENANPAAPQKGTSK